MNARVQRLLPAFVCMLVLPFCALWIHPAVELGIIDDWSYIRSAQVLAQSGHVVYNGWATAMLGWQLYFGALLIRIFGFSFAITRVGTLFAAMVTALLIQRSMVRLGIAAWNSAAATIVFLISPVFLAVTFTFMSDVYGMLVLVACLACCLRSLEARSEDRASAWICAAALGAAVGGTARQVAWVGLVAMVPSTLWLLRRSRVVLWRGALCVIVGIVFVAWSLVWFSHQPFALSEHLQQLAWPGLKTFLLHMLPAFLKLCIAEILLLGLPVLLVFTPKMIGSRRTILGTGTLTLFALLYAAFLHKTHQHDKLFSYFPPYLYNNLYYRGFEQFQSYVGDLPMLLTDKVRATLGVLSFLGVLGLAGALLSPDRIPEATRERGLDEGPVPDWHRVFVLLLPSLAMYMVLLIPRHLSHALNDRYLLFPEFVFLVFAALLYQQRVATRFTPVIWGLILVCAALVTGGLHDTFALYHAQESLLEQLTSSGIARTAIDGGGQYNGWTQVIVAGHVNDPRIRIPAGAFQLEPVYPEDDPCHTPNLDQYPSIQARYVVSLNPTSCGGPSDAAPVSFHTFFAPHVRTVYAVVGPYRNRRP